MTYAQTEQIEEVKHSSLKQEIINYLSLMPHALFHTKKERNQINLEINYEYSLTKI